MNQPSEPIGGKQGGLETPDKANSSHTTKSLPLSVDYKPYYWCTCGNNYYPHKTRAVVKEHKQGNIAGYDYEVNNYCCEEMEAAIIDGAIHLYDDGYPVNPGVYFTDCSPYPEGAVFDYYKISYCPFCGTQVTYLVATDKEQE